MLSLLKIIIEGIKIVKGKDISIISLKDRDNFICDYFIICSGKSENQVHALYQSIEKIVYNKLKKNPYHIEGIKNRKWILVDYVSVVAHIFLEEIRVYYDIENLWKKNNI